MSQMPKATRGKGFYPNRAVIGQVADRTERAGERQNHTLAKTFNKLDAWFR